MGSPSFMMEHGLNPIDEGSLEYLRAVSSDLCSGKEGKAWSRETS